MNWHFLSWQLVVPVLLARILLPLISFFFFCRYCKVPFRWWKGVCYTFLVAGFDAIQNICSIKESLSLLAELLLLMGCGCVLLGRTWIESLSVAAVVLSVVNVSSGMVSWIGYRVLLPLILSHEILLYPSDAVREGLRVLLVCWLSAMILHHFHRSLRQVNRQTLIWLTVPLFYLALVVRMIQTSIYGNEIQVNAETGEILTVWKIDHIEFLLLQIFACVCLFAVLSAYQKIVNAFQAEQQIRLMEQQARVQKSYLQEALLRDRQTRGLRHDMKNHLMVLAGLLRSGQTAQAYDYLVRLEETTSGLIAPVQTGNAAVDALLGSKCQAANQQKISVQCTLAIPVQSKVEEIDWCILLANGLDNAIEACRKVPESRRQIRVYSRKKGALFLIVIENSCDQALQEVPPDGIGLGNIRAVMEKYHGTAETTVSDGSYRLKLFFGSLQLKNDVLHPSSVLFEPSDDVEEESGEDLGQEREGGSDV